MLADMAERKIQMNNRMLEMKITVNSPECCRACDNDESGPCPKFENACRELYSQAASSYVEERAEAAADGFAFLAKNVLEDFEIFNIMSTLLDLEEFDKVDEVDRLLKFATKSKMLTAYEDELFEDYVERIIVFSREEVGFELKCGITLKERLVN